MGYDVMMGHEYEYYLLKAETNHRKRRRRAGRLGGQHQGPAGSFHGTLLRMKEAGISGQQALAALAGLAIMPVFTAHPTEVARQTVLLKRRRIAEQLERLDHVPLSAGEAPRTPPPLLPNGLPVLTRGSSRIGGPPSGKHIEAKAIPLDLFVNMLGAVGKHKGQFSKW